MRHLLANHALNKLFLLFPVGTQFLQRFQKSMITIFHALLPSVYLLTNFGTKPLILLLVQPLAVFLIAEIIPHIISGKVNFTE